MNVKKLILLPILALLLTGCSSSGGGGGGDVDDWGIAKDLNGPKLLYKLHTICFEKHTTYVTYSKFASYVVESDTNPTSVDKCGENPNKNELFYTGKQISNKTSSGWTREHVWACANSAKLWTHEKADGTHYVDGTGYKGGGSDLYHIRPANSTINTQRGNAKIYEFGESDKFVLVGDGGPYKMKVDDDSGYANKYEPADAYKGDVARIIMYVYTHYAKLGGESSEVIDYVGNLNLKDIFNSSYDLQKAKELLVKWNNLDPVSETEKMRNDTVEKIQGNRNPFVDHPEYMARCFDIEM